MNIKCPQQRKLRENLVLIQPKNTSSKGTVDVLNYTAVHPLTKYALEYNGAYYV